MPCRLAAVALAWRCVALLLCCLGAREECCAVGQATTTQNHQRCLSIDELSFALTQTRYMGLCWCFCFLDRIILAQSLSGTLACYLCGMAPQTAHRQYHAGPSMSLVRSGCLNNYLESFFFLAPTVLKRLHISYEKRALVLVPRVPVSLLA